MNHNRIQAAENARNAYYQWQAAIGTDQEETLFDIYSRSQREWSLVEQQAWSDYVAGIKSWIANARMPHETE